MAKVERDERGNIIERIQVVPPGAGEAWAKANRRRDGFDAELVDSTVDDGALATRDARPQSAEDWERALGDEAA